jgi:hypothetical protein
MHSLLRVVGGSQASQPKVPHLPKWSAIQKMMLASPAPLRSDQTGLFQENEMFGQALAGQAGAMPIDQPYMQLKQGLTVSFRQFIDDAAPSNISERSEN